MNETREITGDVRIASDAVEQIAAISVTDIKGVKCLLGGVTREKIGAVDEKTLSKSTKAQMNDGRVQANLSVILDGTVPIPVVTAKIQSKVSDAIEMMTGYEVTLVNVEIAGVEL